MVRVPVMQGNLRAPGRFFDFKMDDERQQKKKKKKGKGPEHSLAFPTIDRAVESGERSRPFNRGRAIGLEFLQWKSKAAY